MTLLFPDNTKFQIICPKEILQVLENKSVQVGYVSINLATSIIIEGNFSFSITNQQTYYAFFVTSNISFLLTMQLFPCALIRT